jgi:uncharacterized protein YndB with AHSA1/START domain
MAGAQDTPAGPGDAVSVRDDGPLLRATVALPGCTAARALAAFTDPAQLAAWWLGELEADLKPGGPYVVRFPQVPATMTGRVVSWVPADLLEFSWAWEHEPDEPPRTVAVRAAGGPPAGLALAHGPYADDDAGRQARADHRAGWEHFLPRLAALLSAPGDQSR